MFLIPRNETDWTGIKSWGGGFWNLIKFQKKVFKKKTYCVTFPQLQPSFYSLFGIIEYIEKEESSPDQKI